MGPPTPRVTRIGVQVCVDGFQAFTHRNQTVKPAQMIVLSLAPWLRYKSENMLVQMLVPAEAKGQGAKKYYDFAAVFEMQWLSRDGVDGVRVICYGFTLDTPGRRELLSMESVSAFYPCPYCLHTWQPGLRGQVYNGYRRYLRRHSSWRQRSFVFQGHTYMFRDVETRPLPIARTDDNVRAMVARATPAKPFCGHKRKSFLDKWGIDWIAQPCDIMHDLKLLCDMLLKGLVGVGRRGMYQYWSKDAAHRDDCEAYGVFPQFHEGGEPPPWRLSPDDVEVLNRRVLSMWWPHYLDVLISKGGDSFWTDPSAAWKCKNKYFILLVLLPTLLQDFVPAVHKALLVLVDALRRLTGQVVCMAEAISLGVLPGSKVIDRRTISSIRKQLIRGLVLLEGSFPVGHLNPALHHVVHYPGQTGYLGLLELLAMWAFERNNHRVKTFVHRSFFLKSCAKKIMMDIAARLERFSEIPDTSSHCTCTLGARRRKYALSAQEKFDLGMLGVEVFDNVKSCLIANILGVHFKAGEWGQKRCGSVITTVYGGDSLYCVVRTFLQVQDKLFARVEWLSKPIYPHMPIKLVAKVRILPPARQSERRCVIPVEKIDPCTVTVLPDSDGTHFFMMRSEGHNRTVR